MASISGVAARGRGASTPSVDAYRNLDLSPDSDAVKNLKSRVEAEAESATIVLTSAKQTYDARQPALLTPMMASWYMERVGGLRVGAIADLHNGFQHDTTADGGAKSVYLEVQRDAVRSKGIREAIEETDRFLQRHKDLIDRHDRARAEFHTLKARMGREPVRPRPVVYVLALLGLVMLEAFINFESFLKVPYITSPFLATGATLAVAVGIAFAAHFHGIVLRQAGYLFSPQEAGEKAHAERKNDAVRRVIIGAVLLLVALLMVGGSRYYYLRDYILQAQILGTSAPSMTGGIGFMLFGNIVAYIVATLVAYALHDPHPIYAEKDREFKRTTKEIEAAKVKRRAAQETLRQGVGNELTAVNNHDASARGPRYGELRQMASAIDEKDQEVLGALMSYRATLIQAMAARSDVKLFRLPDGAHDEIVPPARDVLLTPQEYASLPLSLGFTVADQ